MQMKSMFSPRELENHVERTEIEIIDETGSRRRKAKLPARVEVGELMGALVSKLSLPLFDAAGQPLTYHLDHKQTGNRIAADDSLSSAGVKDGDLIRISAEIIAG